MQQIIPETKFHPLRSPVAPNEELITLEVEPGLEAFGCPVTRGIWIPLQSYLNWKQSYAGEIRPLPPGYKPEALEDTDRSALLCPESGCLLIRYRVGHGLKFHIEHSPQTGGVWLDAGEWEALKSKGLHDELHLIFSASYQHKIQTEAFDEQLHDRFKARIGEKDFRRAVDFSQWLRQHPRKRDIMAFLRDEQLE
jgi:Zn-finger nucleic acid-binding protein